MAKFAMRGTHSSTGAIEPTEEDRRCYRRWARASLVVDFIAFAALLIGFSLYDWQTARKARNDLTAGIDMRAISASAQNAGRGR